MSGRCEAGNLDCSVAASEQLKILRQAVTRALYDHTIANVTGPIDQDEMTQRAIAFLPTERRGYSSGTAAFESCRRWRSPTIHPTAG